MIDWSLVRQDFPILSRQIHSRSLVYFDSAATSLKPKQVIDTLTQFYSYEYGTVHRAVYHLAEKSTEMYANARLSVQRFINASSAQEIIFNRGTTAGLNFVAQAYGRKFLKEGDQVLLSEMEHHSNIIPWQLLAKEVGIEIKWVPVTEQGTLDLDRFYQLLSPKVKLVAVTHLSNVLGTVNPIEKIVEAAHLVGAKVVVDGAQSTPHMKVDVERLGCDFFAFSGHKLCAPTGVGVLYGKEELLEMLDPIEGGGDMIEQVTCSTSQFQPPPLRFEAGTPMIAQVIGLGSAIEYLEEMGMDTIAEREGELYQLLQKGLTTLPDLTLLGTAEGKGALQTMVVKGVHPLDLATMLDFKGIAVRTGHHCAQPLLKRFGIDSALRASLAFYNSEEEVEYFITSLKEVIADLR